MCYINPHFTYLLAYFVTYLLTYLRSHLPLRPLSQYMDVDIPLCLWHMAGSVPDIRSPSRLQSTSTAAWPVVVLIPSRWGWVGLNDASTRSVSLLSRDGWWLFCGYRATSVSGSPDRHSSQYVRSVIRLRCTDTRLWSAETDSPQQGATASPSQSSVRQTTSHCVRKSARRRRRRRCCEPVAVTVCRETAAVCHRHLSLTIFLSYLCFVLATGKAVR